MNKPNNSRSWFSISAKSADEAEVFIYDEIGFWGTTAKAFIDQVKATKAKKLTLRLNTPGGDVFDGLAIYNFLKAYDVTVSVDGLAASMGSIIALAGKTVKIAANGFFMIHNPWSMAMGEADDMREAADLLDKIGEQLCSTYAAATGKDPAECKKWMQDSTWFNAQEALAAGLVDEITEPVAFSAKLDKFARIPAALLAPTTQTATATLNTEPKMQNLIKALADASLVNAADTEEAAHVASFTANLAKMREELTDLRAKADTIAAKDERITALQAKLDAYAKAEATAKVQAAITAGKIKADALDTWVARLLTDKDGETLLNSLPEAKAPGAEPVNTKVTESKEEKLTGLARAIAAHRKASSESNN